MGFFSQEQSGQVMIFIRWIINIFLEDTNYVTSKGRHQARKTFEAGIEIYAPKLIRKPYISTTLKN